MVVLVIIGAALWSANGSPSPPPPQQRQALVDVVDGPGGQDRVQIDTTLFAPAQTPAPAILLAHGFGEDKNSVAGEAEVLARRGFTVVTYSARGFGHSTGQIGLNSPDYEVTDARQIIDWMARQPEVLRDGENDPRIGVTGASYGGALSLLLAGSDPRVDAVAPVLTYNDLAQALLPNTAAPTAPDGATPAAGISGDQGVFKRAWAGLLFSAGGRPPSPAPPTFQPGADSAPLAPDPITCGNFTVEVCTAYDELAQTGRADPATRNLLARVSPSSVTHNIKIPTLLVQGERDTLFGLDQADANARQIAAAGGSVKMIWYDGGHDGPPPGPALEAQIGDWFAAHLGLLGAAPASDPLPGFSYQVPGRPQRGGTVPERTVTAPVYPGLKEPGAPTVSLPLDGPPATVVNPAGGLPASISSVPGVNGGITASLARDMPGQAATFHSPAVRNALVISGVPRARLSVASEPGQPNPGEAVLFAKLYDVAPDGQRSLIGNAVSALRVPNLPIDGTPVTVEVALPGVVRSVAAGHHLDLVLSTTDQSYASPAAPAVYRVGLAGASALSVPSVSGTTTGPSVPVGALTGIAVIAALAVFAVVVERLRRRDDEQADPDLADTPLAISGLRKAYGRKLTAVDRVSLRVERGQIVGLLGPNGAGKTTTLRMLLGLLHPTAGQISVFGHPVRPGAPVLSRVGSLVEGPGFLPHLSGVDNLRHYWAATGRPAPQARFGEALRIAGLGAAAHRRVRTYSHGMRQRLAIAQAMLGLPDLLVLDEPTNGLDPPQIHQLREVLRRYAATGRAVLLSSHLLAEVEQTCTHVVVLHRGRLVTEGSVEDIVSGNGEATFRVDEPEQAAATLRSLEGLGKVHTEGNLVHADLAGHTTAIAVNALVASGVLVSQVGPRRRLEDAFLQLVDPTFADSTVLQDDPGSGRDREDAGPVIKMNGAGE